MDQIVWLNEQKRKNGPSTLLGNLSSLASNKYITRCSSLPNINTYNSLETGKNYSCNFTPCQQ